MGVVELLTDLRRRGFNLTPERGHLHVSPGSALTPELRQAIRSRKQELLALLTEDERARELLCCYCGGEARHEDGKLSLDETGYIVFWRCLSCGARGSTAFRLQ